MAPAESLAASTSTPIAANDDANCVPWNIWQDGGVDPAALAYLQTPGFSAPARARKSPTST